jgi:hypothetical protein
MGIFNKSGPSGTAPVINAGAPKPAENNAHGRPITPAPVAGSPAQAETAKPQVAGAQSPQPDAGRMAEVPKA